EGQVNRVPSQFHGVGFADHADDVSQPLFLARLLNVLNELGCDVHREHFSVWTNLLGEPAREQTGARSDVCDDHSGFQLASCQNLLSPSEDLTTLDLELAQILGDTGIFKWLVDARPNAFVLRDRKTCRSR